jgi:hypothetical protein
MNLRVKDNSDTLNSIGFNNNIEYIILGTPNGYKVIEIKSLEEIINKDSFMENFNFIEIKDESNLFYLVKNDEFGKDKHKLIIWNDENNEKVGQILFKNEIKNIKTRKDKFFIKF